MAKLVILKLNGTLNWGFQVSLEIGLEREFCYRGVAGRLPPKISLKKSLTAWMQEYELHSRKTRIKPKKIIYNGGLNFRKKLRDAAGKLETELENWLESPQFLAIDRALREELDKQEAIRVLLCTNCQELWQLPWHCWSLARSYSQLEIAFSYLNFERVLPDIPRQTGSKVKILAILGHSKGIDVGGDREFLNSLANAEVTFLVEPQRQKLYDNLYGNPWDIIFFAGHSETVGERGILYLNPEDELSLEELSSGFKKAIASGLKLAIFNSCDGLGLATELANLGIPQAIVMRLPIPDLVAQQFVKYFLSAYIQEGSLYLAAKKAREKLEGWEKHFPYASWLPVIYQNPALSPPSWQELQNKKEAIVPQVEPLKKNQKSRSSKKQQIYASCILAVIVAWLLQTGGWLQAVELQVYDRWMSWRALQPADERILVVTIDDLDIQYQRSQGMKLEGSLADEALARTIDKLQSYQPNAIASDIIHDFPFSTELANTIAKNHNFFAICRIENNFPQSEKLNSIAPPPSLPREQIGFSNLVIDSDRTIRRQIIGMSPDRTCQSDYSLSFRLALNYLKDFPTKVTTAGIVIGDTVFPRLQKDSGGYQLSPNDSQGYQILLNYNFATPQTITLREVLNSSLDDRLPDLVKNRIVLIGRKSINGDLHQTPQTKVAKTNGLSGIYIHSQAISQIISTVLQESSLLWWVPNWVEFIWIVFWSAVGGLIIYCYRLTWQQTVALMTALTLLFASSFALFLFGGWIVAIAPALALTLTLPISIIWRKTSKYRQIPMFFWQRHKKYT